MATPVPQKDDVEHWTVEEMAAWLQQVELSECCDIFLRKGIDGHQFLQLTEEDLFLWGRDVSIRNRKHILKLVSQIKNLQQHSSTIRPTINDHHSYATNDDESDFSDFSNQGEEEEEEVEEEEEEVEKEEQGEEGYPVAERQPVQDADISDCHVPVRAPFPTPRNQSKERDKTLSDLEAMYLEPIEVKPPPNVLGLRDKGFQRFQQSPPPPPTFPFATKGPGMTRNLSSGRIPPLGDGIPAPSSLKKISGDSQAHPQRPKVVNQPSFLASNNSLTGASENGRGGAMGSSFLHRLHQENKPAPLPPKPKEPPWVVPSSQEKNEHVYEYVGNPSASCGGPETPGSAVTDRQSSVRPPLPPLRNQNQDLDDLELSSRLGVATLSHKKKPPVSLKLSGGSDSGSASGSPKHISCNRPTTGNHPLLANCSSFSCKTSPSENPPNEFAPPLPYVSLDDGKRLKLIPLYQKLMEKPYFHLISRPKAKNLIMSGEDGMFLIRPSTKSGDPLTLVLNLEKHLYNINIRQRPDSLFALGKEKAQEKAFSSLDELVITYTTEPIKLENGKMAFLKHSPSKTRLQ
ncbi:uncharacterized protein LOC135107490 isoform X3 [Scylla paramamosain]